jgi:hypothetical protein
MAGATPFILIEPPQKKNQIEHQNRGLTIFVLLVG